MKTAWKEYPRPSLVRDSYKNINGTWQYAIRKKNSEPSVYDGEIQVPFSPEADLSGVNRQLQPDEYLYYRRSVWIEADFLDFHTLLHFGAVDQSCRIYWNHIEVGHHQGGYLPFTVDVTDAIQQGENEVQVIVEDQSDTSYFARGKQRLQASGMFYTAQSGIWQTVWMESVPAKYVKELRITPNLDSGEIALKVFVPGGGKENVQVRISLNQTILVERKIQANQEEKITIPKIQCWSPETPVLYDLTVILDKDQVDSYFAMRKFSMEKDECGIIRFFLNNQPYFPNGLLDQGYWKDGLYTPSQDEEFVRDIKRTKSLGFNMLRKHIKIEPERWYYHCDRLGMMVWQDMINGGGQYHMGFVCILINFFPVIGRQMRDSHYRLLARQSREGKKMYDRELKAMIHHLYNHPSIALWVPFNEGWGQFDANSATEKIRKWDSTRLIDQASGWFDQKGGDVFSIHNYFRKVKIRPQDRMVALTEFGGVSYQVPGHEWSKKIYGYGIARSRADFTNKYLKLFQREVINNIKKGLSASVYTQLADVEEEINGLYTYDRQVLKIDEDKIRECNEKLQEEFLTSVRKDSILCEE